MNLYDYIEEIPDFPVKGILFKDISLLLAKNEAVNKVKTDFLKLIKPYQVDLIGGLDARGFLFSTLIADALGVGSFMIRKEGKLPGGVISKEYELEYGVAKLSVKKNLDLKNKNIILIDDLLATGGTLKCAEDLISFSKGTVVSSLVVIELVALSGKDKLNSTVHSLLKYDT